jgi:CBS domain containing-hemolysin-like protein
MPGLRGSLTFQAFLCWIAQGKLFLDDGSSLSSWVALLLLILLHAIITLSYVALKNARQAMLREQAGTGSAGARRVLNLTADFARLQLTHQLTITLIRFAIAALVTLSASQFLAGNGDMSPLAGYLLFLVPAALLTLILADIVPSAVASAQADSLASGVAYLMMWLVFLFSPVVALMLAISRTFSKAVGGEDITETITEEEIMTLVDAGEKAGTIEDEEKEMIYSVLQFGETLAREVMVPRIDVVALDIETSLMDAVHEFIESGHSRIPVYEESIDNIKGLLYAKDVLSDLQHGSKKSMREMLRPVYFVPETKRADILLKELQSRKVHMALVVDEYGGTAGLVTIEDLLEEIVGDIRDEYDLHEEAEFERHSDDEFTVDAAINIDDFNALFDTQLSDDDADTLGGYIYNHFGRVPLVGETVEAHGFLIRIEEVEGQRIRKVRVTRVKPEAPPDVEGATDGEATEPESVTD